MISFVCNLPSKEVNCVVCCAGACMAKQHLGLYLLENSSDLIRFSCKEKIVNIDHDVNFAIGVDIGL